MSDGVELDCQRCGACCCNRQENIDEDYVDYIAIGPRDALFRRKEMLARFAVRNGAGELHLKILGKDQRCAALTGELGRRVQCRIYTLRPHPCRRVQAGDRECLRARVERGLPVQGLDANGSR